ncbi:Glycerophosphoryl diester phosphodiesterase family-domain-containing protein [Xylariaceae sp. FL1272]|nr:Glycerophosphoryl diester phosphodiesterase family-domain-containing protein [Xylariaceae sp. FL1272]
MSVAGNITKSFTMKFGRDLPWHLIPKWANFYINYDEWKHLAKTNTQKLGEAVIRDSRKVDNLLGRQHEVIAQRLSVLNDQYGITLESWRQETLFHSIPDFEKQDITTHLKDTCALLTSLNDYISVTQQAVDRVRSKTSDASSQLVVLVRTLQAANDRCIKDIQSINSTLQALRSTKPIEGYITSLLLARCGSTKGGHAPQKLAEALRRDSVADLKTWLDTEQSGNQTMPLVLIKAAVSCSASKCVLHLVSRIDESDSFAHLSSYNPLSLYVQQAYHQTEHSQTWDNAVHGAQAIIDSMEFTYLSEALITRDTMGRTALHYAAEYGMDVICEQHLELLASNPMVSSQFDASIIFSADGSGDSSVSLSVSEGHKKVLDVFLAYIEAAGQTGRSQLEELIVELVSLAIRSQRNDITETLLDHEPRLLKLYPEAPRLLYMASQYGQDSIVSRLMTYTSDINYREPVQGKIPLMIASIYEHTTVVEVLLKHPNCDIRIQDFAGWTAVDHTAFRGPPALVKTIQGQNKDSSVALGHPSHTIQPSGRRSKSRNVASQEISSETDYDVNHVFVNLGHFDMEKEPSILNIEAFRKLVAPVQIPESSLTLEITGINCDSTTPHVITFPILSDLCNDPLHFTTKDMRTAKLLFRVYSSVLPCGSGTQKPSLVGSAIASLKDAREGLGPSLESLERDHIVSLVSSEAFGYNYAGSFTFTFVVSRPFMFEGAAPKPPKLDLRRDDVPWVAGHRGLGQNNPNKDRLQLGENTMDSFRAALSQGAEILEDVQVTRDLVPVIYHDFLVSEIGADIGVHSISYEQFMVPSIMQDSTVRPHGTSDSLLKTAESRISQKPRANSVGKVPPDNIDVIARLMSTFNLHNFGFKGNVGSECIHGPFITLEQLLLQIDPSVCFDVELKYPMLFEARDFELDTFAMELNTYLDSILATVYKHAGSRPIFFTSFSPELCILLATKQQLYPVMFLTESGYIPTRDIRAISFQEAVRFARKWNLEGVVPRSQPIVASPRLVDLVKSSGLTCASWGDLNDDTECAKAQADVKIDGIITNRVGEIVRTLRS